jgi:hypothetical protein
VGKLPSIASRLVTPVAPAAPAVVTPAPQPATPVEQPVQEAQLSTEEVAPAQPVAAQPEPVAQPVAVDNEKAAKNKNRVGLQIMMVEYCFGKLGKEYYDSTANKWKQASNVDSLYQKFAAKGYTTNISRIPGLRLGPKVMIAAGPFLAIAIGPTCFLATENYKYSKNNYDTTDNFEGHFTFIAPALSLGVNFTKRFYPVKINAGIAADVNFVFMNYKNSWSYYYISSGLGDSGSTNDSKFKTNVSFGAKTGAEIMMGPHFSLGLDLMYKFSRLESRLSYNTTNAYTSNKRYTFAGFGLGTSINTYFK